MNGALEAASTVAGVMKKLREDPDAIQNMLSEIAEATESYNQAKQGAEKATTELKAYQHQLREHENQLHEKELDLNRRVEAHRLEKESLAAERQAFEMEKSRFAHDRSALDQARNDFARERGAVIERDANLQRLVKQTEELKADLERRLAIVRQASG